MWGRTVVNEALRPYFDDDFEVFIDGSQSNYFYVEFELNARSKWQRLWVMSKP